MKEHLVGMGRLLRMLSRPLSVAAAVDLVRRDVDRREERFLETTRDLIFARAGSPHRRLLEWAGCSEEDLAASVHRLGIEETLLRLAAAGVFISFDEFKGRVPVERPGLSFEVSQKDFDPADGTGGIRATTSGSRSTGTAAIFEWDLIEEHAATELLLASIHGVFEGPKALWLPAPPGLAGIHAVLLYAKGGQSFDRWFTQVTEDSLSSATVDRRTMRLGTLAIRAACRIRGTPVPRAEHVRTSDAAIVARWIADHIRAGKPPMLRTYASAAVRIAQAAAQEHLDVAGALMLTGGEPLTDSRRAYIEAQGMRCFPRYSAADAGLIGASCDQRTSSDEMHLYENRFAVVTTDSDPQLLLTTLTPNPPKVLFNTSIGDTGSLHSRPCSCLFGEVGMQRRVMNVQSSEKITHEGMNVSVSDLERITAAVIQRTGGSPSDFQLWSYDRDGVGRVKLAVSPSVPLTPDLESELLLALGREIRGGSLTSAMWEEGQTLEIVREEPIVSKAQKLHPLVKLH